MSWQLCSCAVSEHSLHSLRLLILCLVFPQAFRRMWATTTALRAKATHRTSLCVRFQLLITPSVLDSIEYTFSLRSLWQHTGGGVKARAVVQVRRPECDALLIRRAARCTESQRARLRLHPLLSPRARPHQTAGLVSLFATRPVIVFIFCRCDFKFCSTYVIGCSGRSCQACDWCDLNDAVCLTRAVVTPCFRLDLKLEYWFFAWSRQ